MTAPIFPETPISDDSEWLREQERREQMAAHWRRGWRSGFDRVDGVPVRMWFWECPADCPCHDDDWWGR